MTWGDRSCSKKRFTATSVWRQVPRNTSPKLPMPILGPSVSSSASISHSALLSAQPSQSLCLCSYHDEHDNTKNCLEHKDLAAFAPLKHQAMVISRSSGPHRPLFHTQMFSVQAREPFHVESSFIKVHTLISWVAMGLPLPKSMEETIWLLSACTAVSALEVSPSGVASSPSSNGGSCVPACSARRA